MELQHFIHPHPLTLVEEQNSDDGQKKCNGCGSFKPIVGPFYICTDNECPFVLNYECPFVMHKSCAEQPQKIHHPAHPEHPLTLLYQPDVTYQCVACYMRDSDLFYYCELCDLYLDLPCAILPQQIEHIGHQHPLTLQLKPSLFCCDACGKLHDYQAISYQCTTCNFWVHKDCVSLPDTVDHASHDHPSLSATLPQQIEHIGHQHTLALQLKSSWFCCDACGKLHENQGILYQCTTCHFWVHEDCVSLPDTVNCNSHDHPLALANCFRLEFSRSRVYCDICSKVVKQMNCVYCCSRCRYVAHVGCAQEKIDGNEESERKDESDESNLVCLPLADESVDLTKHLLEKLCLRENDGETDLEHPLHRFDEYSGSEDSTTRELKGDEMCNACMERILAPYYSCSDCDFLLHKHCAELPSDSGSPDLDED